MLVYPHAKINIGLNVIKKRNDGYHDIETIFYPIFSCTDALEILKSQFTDIEILDMNLNINTKENLVFKAFELIKSVAKKDTTEIQVYLRKGIPSGAGMGGGSSDAAFTLKVLNDMWQLNLSQNELEKLASKIGSDCVFFLQDEPAYGTSKGDKLDPVQIDLSNYNIKLVHSPIHISTAEAYANITPKIPQHSLKELIKLPVEEWKGNVINDFEEYALTQFPELASIKNTLYEEGALYASMTGTGSTMYGIFSKPI